MGKESATPKDIVALANWIARVESNAFEDTDALRTRVAELEAIVKGQGDALEGRRKGIRNSNKKRRLLNRRVDDLAQEVSKIKFQLRHNLYNEWWIG